MMSCPKSRCFRPEDGDLAAQDCPLLRLPAELRNAIYEYVCLDVDKVALFHGPEIRVLATTHPLGQTCHQINAEFSPVYRAEAPQKAREFICLRNNFSSIESTIILEAWIESLPPLPNHEPRSFVQSIFLDNSFGSGLAMKNADSAPHWSLGCKPPQPSIQAMITVHFNSRTFDVDYLRSFIARYVHGRLHHSSALSEALEKAINRHDRMKAEAKQERPLSRQRQTQAVKKPKGKASGKVVKERNAQARRRR